jgi:hypothetical protein
VRRALFEKNVGAKILLVAGKFQSEGATHLLLIKQKRQPLRAALFDYSTN